MVVPPIAAQDSANRVAARECAEATTGLSDSGLDGGWTADGYIKYDITDDGEGPKTWSLHGSPRIN